jgi:hypothetical protein
MLKSNASRSTEIIWPVYFSEAGRGNSRDCGGGKGCPIDAEIWSQRGPAATGLTTVKIRGFVNGAMRTVPFCIDSHMFRALSTAADATPEATNSQSVPVVVEWPMPMRQKS